MTGPQGPLDDERRLITPMRSRRVSGPPRPAARTVAAAGYPREGPVGEMLAAAADAGRLAGWLLAASRAERLGMVASDAAFQQATLARLLALGAEERLDEPPPAAEEYAELALAVATVLVPATAEDLRLRLLCSWLLAKAQLRAGRLEAAEANLASIGDSAGIGDRALAAAGVAQLRWYEGRELEALGLLHAAARAFAELNDAPAVGACRSLSGLLLLGSGEPMCARLELRGAHRVLGRSCAPSLAVLVCLGLACCDAVLGGAAAVDFFAVARDAARASRRPALGFGSWWEAVLGLGREPTDARLEAACREALANGEVIRAACATLERAVRRIADDDGESAARLVAPLAALGEAGEMWCGEIAALAPLAARRPLAIVGASQEVALRLAAQALPRLATERLPWGVCDLADRLLRQRLEGEHPLGAARVL
jgi:hypothetical protein